MTHRAAPAVLAVLIALLTACCSPGGGNGIVTPPQGLTDEIVVPAELAEEYQYWVDRDQEPNLVPEEIDGLGIEYRRAFTYYSFIETQVVNETTLLVLSVEIAEGASQAIVETAVALLQATADPEFSHFSPGTGRNVHLTYFARSLTRGELAWCGDWLIQNYPNTICFVSPQSGDGTPI